MEPLQSSLTALDRLLYDGEALRVGLVEAPPSHPAFRDDGPVHHHAIHFHATPIAFERSRGELVADPHTITFFRRGDAFRRRAIHPLGEHSFWIAYDCGLLTEEKAKCFETADAAFAGRSVYLSYLALRGALCGNEVVDPLTVEESALGILDQALSLAVTGGCRESGVGGSKKADLADAVRSLLALRFDEALSLADIARAMGSSPYHLARVFRQVTGRSIHGYRNGLRLRHALNVLSAGVSDLTRLALDLGYASHSHFSTRFKAAFGLPPADVRAHCGRGDYGSLRAVADRLAPSEL